MAHVVLEGGTCVFIAFKTCVTPVYKFTEQRCIASICATASQVRKQHCRTFSEYSLWCLAASSTRAARSRSISSPWLAVISSIYISGKRTTRGSSISSKRTVTPKQAMHSQNQHKRSIWALYCKDFIVHEHMKLMSTLTSKRWGSIFPPSRSSLREERQLPPHAQHAHVRFPS